MMAKQFYHNYQAISKPNRQVLKCEKWCNNDNVPPLNMYIQQNYGQNPNKTLNRNRQNDLIFTYS